MTESFCPANNYRSPDDEVLSLHSGRRAATVAQPMHADSRHVGRVSTLLMKRDLVNKSCLELIESYHTTNIVFHNWSQCYIQI
jgi:hypothetical protein